MRENKIKRMMDNNELVVGMAFFTGSPVVIQMLGHMGFDFIFIDTEHAPLGVDGELQNFIITANSVGLGTSVRVKSNDEVAIRQAFEFGADMVVIPHCRTAEDARKMVSAGRFPPIGTRGSATDCRSAGYGCDPDFNYVEYLERSNKECMIVPLAEDKEFFDNIDEILAVEGIAGVQLGPADLALSLGLPDLYNFDNPLVKECFEILYRKAKEKNIPLLGPIAPPTLERAQEMVDNGVKVMTLRNDTAHFKLILKGLMDNVYKPLKGNR